MIPLPEINTEQKSIISIDFGHSSRNLSIYQRIHVIAPTTLSSRQKSIISNDIADQLLEVKPIYIFAKSPLQLAISELIARPITPTEMWRPFNGHKSILYERPIDTSVLLNERPREINRSSVSFASQWRRRTLLRVHQKLHENEGW